MKESGGRNKGGKPDETTPNTQRAAAGEGLLGKGDCSSVDLSNSPRSKAFSRGKKGKTLKRSP